MEWIPKIIKCKKCILFSSKEFSFDKIDRKFMYEKKLL